MELDTYNKKRDFRQTPEPKGNISKANRHRFVCQEHHASSLHFDLRLEAGGVLKSWSLRKGPSLDPAVRRLAVPTEDHPVEYLKFEGDIPPGNYGAGQHRIWDKGTYKLLEGKGAAEAIAGGKLKIKFKGEKLKGVFNFFRLGSREQWLLVKSRDEHAHPGWRLELLIPDDNGNKFISEDDTKRRVSGTRGARRPAKEGPVLKTKAKAEKNEKLPTLAGALRAREPKGDKRVKIGNFVLELTSLDRIYWPDEGYTKADLIRYYDSVSRYILPYLKDRPIIMKRYPLGIAGKSFHQHDVNEVPEFVRTIALEAEDGGAHTVDYIVCDDLATHLYLANLGAIERHPWHSRTDNLDEPDWFVFDLDPGDEVKFATICELAASMGEVMRAFGLDSYPKTSGSRGIHLYVPIRRGYPFELVADLAARIAKAAADKNPAIATVERSKGKRKRTQIYIDHLQNAYGKSVVAPYSARPKPGAPVSAPLEWDEIERGKIDIQDFTIENIMGRIKNKGDLFKPVLTIRQSLEEALAASKTS